MQYTHLNNSSKKVAGMYYKYLQPTEKTIYERNKIKGGIDNYATFKWRHYDAFENFGAFIINEKKGSLKFYNGQNFSNEYSTPQFDSGAGDLTGIKFNRQTIAFTIGVYWITDEDYKLFLDWLNPYEINDLQFGFNENYRYLVKLTGMKDTTKYIVGWEGDKRAFYTELALTFEVQGAQCALSVNNMMLEEDETALNTYIIKNRINGEDVLSDLDTPFLIEGVFNIPNTAQEASITATLKDEVSNDHLTLFHIDLHNFSPDDSDIYIRYDSELGLIFWGEGYSHILSNLTTVTSGKTVVNGGMIVNKAIIPGKLTNWNRQNYNDLKLQFDYNNLELSEGTEITLWAYSRSKIC